MARNGKIGTRIRRAAICVVALGWLTLSAGCMTTSHNAIPVQQLHPCLLGPTKSGMVPIDFTLLQQPVPSVYVLGPNDTLGVFIEDVIEGIDSQPTVHYPNFENPRTEGQITSPKIGQPIVVDHQGRLPLPNLEPIRVQDLTLDQAVEAIRQAYLATAIIRPDSRILLSLIKPRVHQVTVIREDADPATPTLTRKETYVLTKRGTTQVLELPQYENDVMHALAAGGGLPGEDAYTDIWVLRMERREHGPHVAQMLQEGTPVETIQQNSGDAKFIRIPLRTKPGEPLPFGPEDVILYDGDIVFIEERETEYFYCGGLLTGGKIPLPRDEDLDVLGAVSLANGALGGPAGANAAATNFRSGPGNIIPPSRVIIVRTMPGNQQIKMHVNLNEALDNPRERIIIRPGDVVMLQYTPAELLGNVVLNFVNVGYNIPNN